MIDFLHNSAVNDPKQTNIVNILMNNMTRTVVFIILFLLGGTATGVESFPSPISKLHSRYLSFWLKHFIQVAKAN